MLKIASKLIAAGLIFVAPLVIVWARYKTESSTQVVVVQNPLGVFPTIIIVSVLGVLLWWVTNQFAQMLKENKFGWLSIVFFGLTLGLVLFGSWWILNSVLLSVQQNVEQFVENMTYHKETLFTILWFIGGGIGVAGIGKILDWKLPTP